MSKALAVGRSEHDIATATSERFIASTFQARSQILLLPDANGKLLPLTTSRHDAVGRRNCALEF